MVAAAEAGLTFDAVNRELARIPGEGAHGVRRGDLWMLLGDDDGVKPDAMVLRWLRHHDAATDPVTARLILRRVAVHLSDGVAATVSPWMVDHAVWSAGRLLR